MNKLFAKIIAVALALTVIFSFTACKEVENGSKIERIVITLSLQDADSAEPTVYEVEAKLYVNFAPATVEHVKTLIKNGHYNNVDISNLTSTYFQFGDYNRDANGELKAIDTQVSTITGEFEKRGFTGNKLTMAQGAIVLKRANEGINGGSKYDTGKATLAIALSASAPFNVKEYCVFGKVISDDGDAEADEDSMEYLSSLDKLLKVKQTIADADGRKIFYCVNDETDVEESTEDKTLYNWKGQYFTYAQYEEEYHYFKGILTAEEINDLAILTEAERDAIILSDEEASDLVNKISVDADFMNIPALTAKIVKIELKK